MSSKTAFYLPFCSAAEGSEKQEMEKKNQKTKRIFILLLVNTVFLIFHF